MDPAAEFVAPSITVRLSVPKFVTYPSWSVGSYASRQGWFPTAMPGPGVSVVVLIGEKLSESTFETYTYPFAESNVASVGASPTGTIERTVALPGSTTSTEDWPKISA